MKHIMIILAAFIAVFAVTYADLAPVFYSIEAGGSQRYFGDSSTQVRLDSELVTITLGKDSYTVEAVFWFYNEGPELTTEIGFPETIYHYARRDFQYGRDKLLIDIDSNLKYMGCGNYSAWFNNEKVDHQTRNEYVSVECFPKSFDINHDQWYGFVDWMNANSNYSDSRFSYRKNTKDSYHNDYDTIHYSFVTINMDTINISFSSISPEMFGPPLTGLDQLCDLSYFNNGVWLRCRLDRIEYNKLRSRVLSYKDEYERRKLLAPEGDPTFTFITTKGNTIELSYTNLHRYAYFTDKRWLVSTVTFPANGPAVSRVSYTTPYSSEIDYKMVSWNYIYGTGMYWKGNIKKAAFVQVTDYDEPSGAETVEDRFSCSEKRNLKINKIDGKRTEMILYDIEPGPDEYIRGMVDYMR